MQKVESSHAGLRVANDRVLEADAAFRETRYQRLPFVSARSSFTRGDHPVFVFGSLMEQGRFSAANFAIPALNHPSDLTNIKSGLDLGLPLFTGLELTSASRQRELAARQARMEWSALAQQVRFQSAALYLEALLTKSLLQELDERLAASGEEIRDAKRLKDRGVVLGSDYFAALALYNGLSAWRVDVSAQQQSALRRLAILSSQSDVRVSGSLPDKAPEASAFDSLQAKAISLRPDLASAALQADQVAVGSRQASRTIWPRVEGFATWETNTNDFDSNPTNHLFGVAAKLPFGDPSYVARRARSSASHSAAKDSLKSAEDHAAMDLAEAASSYDAARQALPLVNDMAENAAESLRLFRPLYRNGRQSILDVMRAEEALAKARTMVWQSRFRLQMSYLKLMMASGQLDESVMADLGRRLEARP